MSSSRTVRVAAMALLLFMSIWLTSILAKSSGSGSNHDLSLYQYTDDGQVAQVAYAAQLVDRSDARVAFYDEQSDAVVMILLKKSVYPDILDPNSADSSCQSTRSIRVLEDAGLVLMLAGYTPDCNYVLKGINGAVQDHSLRYGESPDVRFLSLETSLRIVEGLYKYSGRSAVARPLAAAVIMASSRRGSDTGKVWQVDNSGSVSARRIALLGSMSELQKRDIVDAISRRNLNNDDDSMTALLSKCKACLELLEGEEDRLQYEVECCVIVPRGPGSSKGRQLRVIHSTPMTSAGDLIDWLGDELRKNEASSV